MPSLYEDGIALFPCCHTIPYIGAVTLNDRIPPQNVLFCFRRKTISFITGKYVFFISD